MIGQFWLRVGELSEYEAFGDDLYAVAAEVNEALFMAATSDLRIDWRQGGFEIGVFRGHDYISCYVGNEEPNFLRNLTRAEQLEFEEALANYWYESHPTP